MDMWCAVYFLFFVTGHLNSLSKELQVKDNLIMKLVAFGNKAFKVKRGLLEYELKLHKIVYFSLLTFPENTCLPRNYSRTTGAEWANPGLQILQMELMLFALPFKADIAKTPENLHTEFNFIVM